MNRFFALSRTRHGILDLATPAFFALVWLDAFPDMAFTALALLTAFAGYTAIYALNDLVGFKGDKEKYHGSVLQSGYSVEASTDHHPMVQGVLSMKAALAWTGFWLITAFAGAYLLNPVIVLILLVGGLVEIIYCKLLKITYLRILLAGVVKATGPIAAVFAVDANPQVDFILLLFSWVFLWEVGGQNIPADWNDVEEDKRIGAKTIPVRFGPNVSATIIFLAVSLTLIASALLPVFSPASLGLGFSVVSLIIGFFLLLRPAFTLWRHKDGRYAASLFDLASHYPVAMFLLIGLWIFATV